jgi:hypothetical protein
MKALEEQLREDLGEAARLEADLGARLATLFSRSPDLFGFSVGERSVAAEDGETGARDLELFVEGIDVCPALGTEQLERHIARISAALADFLDDSPEAADLLAGRTFARIVH